MEAISKILHHLSALGWGWTALFLFFDAVAMSCAFFAIVRQRRKKAAFLFSGAATVGSFGTTVVARVLGLTRAFDAVASDAEPSQKAAELATGISTSMNAAVFGILFTAVAAVAFLACVFSLLLRPER